MSQATDLITKLKTDLLKITPNTQSAHTTINVIAGLLDVAAEEFAPIVESKVDVPTLLSGIGNIENGAALIVTGAAEIERAMKGLVTAPTEATETTEGNA